MPNTVKFKSRITQMICREFQTDGAATLEARQPMRTGQFVVWHQRFILAKQIAAVSEKLRRQLTYTRQHFKTTMFSFCVVALTL